MSASAGGEDEVGDVGDFANVGNSRARACAAKTVQPLVNAISRKRSKLGSCVSQLLRRLVLVRFALLELLRRILLEKNEKHLRRGQAVAPTIL